MISIERHEYKDGAFRIELCFLDSNRSVLRRAFFNQNNELICDVLYEYDKLNRCLGGIVLNKKGDMHCSFESAYSGDSIFECESIERDSYGEVNKRISYEFDECGKPCVARFFDKGSYIGYCALKYADDTLFDEQYFNAEGMPVNGFCIKSLWPI